MFDGFAMLICQRLAHVLTLSECFVVGWVAKSKFNIYPSAYIYVYLTYICVELKYPARVVRPVLGDISNSILRWLLKDYPDFCGTSRAFIWDFFLLPYSLLKHYATKKYLVNVELFMMTRSWARLHHSTLF